MIILIVIKTYGWITVVWSSQSFFLNYPFFAFSVVHQIELRPCNCQLSKSIVHEIFGDIAVMKIYSERYFDTDWQFEMFKRGKPMDMILL